MTKLKGFAALDPRRRRQIAGMGGRAAHAQGKRHRYTSEEARAAGRKGGLESQRQKREEKEFELRNDELGQLLSAALKEEA